MTRKHIMQLAGLLAAALMDCGTAAATTVTYNFDEAGWSNNFGTSENFTGSFSGTVEANGAVTLSDLTGFTATITESNAQGDTKAIATFTLPTGTSGLNTFLFDTNANMLSLGATGVPGATICLGDAVSQGACGPLGPRPVSRTGVPAPLPEGLFLSTVNADLNGYTFNTPSITLVQTTLGPGVGSAPASTPTPEPATMALCGGALVLVSVGMRRGGTAHGRS
jgi:hypothetical protein